MDEKELRDTPEASFEDAFQNPELAEKSGGEPLIRVMALHAMAYCERLFYLEEVEEIRVADANVYEGRRLHETVNVGEEVLTLELASESLGIRGKADCVRKSDGRWFVLEHKKGRSCNGNAPWPSDRLQVLAYSLLLAEETGTDIQEARIRYHADKKLIKIPVDLEVATIEVQAEVSRARSLRASLERPSVSVHERQCRKCSLAPVCLPEEDRAAEEDKAKIDRLFPADDDRRLVHIVEQGAGLSRHGEEIIVRLPDGEKKRLAGRTIGALVLHGNVQITTQCLYFCAVQEIGVHWLTYGGRYIGSLVAGAGAVQRKIRQHKALANPAMCAALAAAVCHAKAENQLKYILRQTRGAERSPEMNRDTSRIRQILSEISDMQKKAGEEQAWGKDRLEFYKDRLRGLEGIAAKSYFAMLPKVLAVEEGELLYFSGRNRRPPKDSFNALLSFGYALLYRDCVGTLCAVGLEPALGFFHAPRSAAYPLALDLMELFRVIMWDMPVVGSVNRKQWNELDFTITGKKVWLSDSGRRKAIGLYENRKREKWKHPVLGYSLSYGRTLELEARLLEKEWCGVGGLFAKLRLR